MKPPRISSFRALELLRVSWRPLRPTLCCAAFALLSACQTPATIEASSQPTDSNLSSTASAAEATRYFIRSDLSDVRFLVFRAGPLATLGHNHVIQARNMTGEIDLNTNFHRSRFWLMIPVANLTVDSAQARFEEGAEFTELPSAAAIAGTTANMLGDKVLDATRYPQIDIRSVRLGGPAWAPDVTIRIKLRDLERDITVPVSIVYQDNEITVTAVFEIKQTDFGIAPLSILGGAIQVADTLRVRMRIVAQKR